MRRKPLGKNFRVLVVPEGHLQVPEELTIPALVKSADERSPWIAVAAQATPTTVEAAFWAMRPVSRRHVVQQLRELADFLETEGRRADWSGAAEPLRSSERQ